MHQFHIPQCTIQNRNVHISVEMCTFLFWRVHSGIWNRCFVGFVKLVCCYMFKGRRLCPSGRWSSEQLPASSEPPWGLGSPGVGWPRGMALALGMGMGMGTGRGQALDSTRQALEQQSSIIIARSIIQCSPVITRLNHTGISIYGGTDCDQYSTYSIYST